MSLEMNIVPLMLFSISAVAGLGPGYFLDRKSHRQCRKVEVSLPNSDPIFYPVPSPYDKKYYFIPFTIDTTKVTNERAPVAPLAGKNPNTVKSKSSVTKLSKLIGVFCY